MEGFRIARHSPIGEDGSYSLTGHAERRLTIEADGWKWPAAAFAKARAAVR